MKTLIKSGLKNWGKKSPSRELLIKYAWKQKKRLFVVFCLGIGGAAFEGFTFALLAIALEILATNGGLPPERFALWAFGWLATWTSGKQFVFLVIVAVSCQIAKSFCQVLNTQLSTLLSTRAAQDVQQEVLNSILSMDFSSASRYKVGELTNFVVTPAESVAQVLIQVLAWVTNILTVIAYIVVLCGISFPLFVAAFVLFGIVVIIQKRVGQNIGRLSHQLGMKQGDLSRKVVEGVSGLRLVHAFHCHDLVKIQVGRMQQSFMETLQHLNSRMAVLGPLSDALLLVGLGGFLLVGFFLFKQNGSSLLPDLLTFIAVLNRLSGRVSQIGIGWSYIKMHSNRVGVLNSLLSDSAINSFRIGGDCFKGFFNKIKFDNVSLRYPGRVEFALRDVSLEINSGESLALVGPSGSGKSSLADLLLGLYEPTNGKIMVDGKPLDQIDIGSWRQHLGVVSQDTLLFNASIRENLYFAKANAPESELLEALKGADALDFVRSLPQGLDTIIGERGFMLSGGQRQRLAIARAILRAPAILILDEATSSLDTKAERAVQNTIDRLPRESTRLVIAHRLSTVVDSNKIAVLINGSVAEYGTHDYLIKLNGQYSDLWKNQSSSKSCEPESK